MKKTVLFLLTLMVAVAAVAQTTTTAPKSPVTVTQSSALNRAHIKYVNDKWLAQKGNALYLVTLNLEWPQQLGGSEMPALQSYLSQQLFGKAAPTLREALAQLSERTGERITRMPDGDLKRHYLDARVYILWYAREQYISLRLVASETDGSGKAERQVSQCFTYDIPGDRILTRDEVFNESTLTGRYDENYRLLFESAMAENAVCNSADMQLVDLTSLPRDFALCGTTMRFGLGGNPAHDNYSLFPLAQLNELGYTNRKFRKWLDGETKSKKENKENKDNETIVPESSYDITGNDTTVFDLPEEKATFVGGTDSLMAYVMRNAVYPEDEFEVHGRVVVSFIVEKDGSLSDLTVVRSPSLALSRETIRLFRNMPRWKPAVHQGETVRSRVAFPLLFKL